jgi:hypothetical protein
MKPLKLPMDYSKFQNRGKSFKINLITTGRTHSDHYISYPKWIMGPSGPTGRPHPTHVTHEKNFTTMVLMLKI